MSIIQHFQLTHQDTIVMLTKTFQFYQTWMLELIAGLFFFCGGATSNYPGYARTVDQVKSRSDLNYVYAIWASNNFCQ